MKKHLGFVCLVGFVFLLVFHQKLHLARLIEYLLSKAVGSDSALQAVEAERSEVQVHLLYVLCLMLARDTGNTQTRAHTHQVASDKHKLRFAPRMLEAVESQVPPPS